jgi:PIN domain nuclease of toxin-antitoxin system
MGGMGSETQVNGLLLDTNILIAFVNNLVDRLPPPIRMALADRERVPAVSVVSPWEMAIKHAAGKLRLAVPPSRLAGAISQFGFRILPMSMDHALEVAHPEPRTKDPFDRLLLAVCVCEGLKLLTTDKALQGHRLVY